MNILPPLSLRPASSSVRGICWHEKAASSVLFCWLQHWAGPLAQWGAALTHCPPHCLSPGPPRSPCPQWQRRPAGVAGRPVLGPVCLVSAVWRPSLSGSRQSTEVGSTATVSLAAHTAVMIHYHITSLQPTIRQNDSFGNPLTNNSPASIFLTKQSCRLFTARLSPRWFWLHSQ